MKKPDKVLAIAIITLISGILNLFWTIGLLDYWTIYYYTHRRVGDFWIRLPLFPIISLPLSTANLEMSACIELLGNPPRKAKVQNVAIFQIINGLSLSFLSVIFGIINLVFYNDPEVKAYINALKP